MNVYRESKTKIFFVRGLDQQLRRWFCNYFIFDRLSIYPYHLMLKMVFQIKAEMNHHLIPIKLQPVIDNLLKKLKTDLFFNKNEVAI